MKTITRVIIVLLSFFIALTAAILWAVVDCALEPTICESVTFSSKISKTWVITIPFLVTAFIPSRYNKVLMVTRFASILLVGFIFLMGANNTISMILFEKNIITLDIIMGPILALVSFSLMCLLLLPEIKKLTRKFSRHATE